MARTKVVDEVEEEAVVAEEIEEWSACGTCGHSRRVMEGVLVYHNEFDFNSKSMVPCAGSYRSPEPAAQYGADSPADIAEAAAGARWGSSIFSG